MEITAWRKEKHGSLFFSGRVSYMWWLYRGVSRSPWQLRLGNRGRVDLCIFSEGFHTFAGVIAVYHARRESCVLEKGEGWVILSFCSEGFRIRGGRSMFLRPGHLLA